MIADQRATAAEAVKWIAGTRYDHRAPYHRLCARRKRCSGVRVRGKSTRPMKLTAEQEAWMNAQAAKHGVEVGFDVRTRDNLINPMLSFGPGPVGMICKHCKHLQRHKLSKTYIKCGLRLNTGGPATDHRANWPACSKFTLP